jgi:hypothetical protein
MKLKEVQEDYYFFTGKVSDLTRQLALAGIAVIWIFRNPDLQTNLIPDKLINPLVLLGLALGFDLLQYVYQSIAWSLFYGYHRRIKHKNDEDEIEENSKLNIVSWTFFGLKVGCTIIAYFLIGKYILTLI